jgi:hypothetical protein
MATIRISDVVEPFSGECDIVQWLERLTMVAKRLKETTLVDVMPLYLVGPAYAVFSELPESSKADAECIAAALKEAFGLNPFLAYEQLTTRKWRRGEAVDVYMAELRRLAKLADVEGDMVLRRQFIVGLPPAVSRELRATAQVNKTSLSAILDRARALMAESSMTETIGAFAATKLVHRRSDDGGRSDAMDTRRCYRCGKAHLIRNCPEVQGNSSGRAAALAVLPKTL